MVNNELNIQRNVFNLPDDKLLQKGCIRTTTKASQNIAIMIINNQSSKSDSTKRRIVKLIDM